MRGVREESGVCPEERVPVCLRDHDYDDDGGRGGNDDEEEKRWTDGERTECTSV
jgi:hypothetical protein